MTLRPANQPRVFCNGHDYMRDSALFLSLSLSLSSGFKFLHFIMQTAFLSHGRTPQIVMTGNENKCDDNDLQLHDRV